ncbi:MAG: response regulator transcription factor [Deltaproteobacteria bacterium]|nr:response regulator transcription factor [Deltaproteobacteria bacterium]
MAGSDSIDRTSPAPAYGATLATGETVVFDQTGPAGAAETATPPDRTATILKFRALERGGNSNKAKRSVDVEKDEMGVKFFHVVGIDSEEPNDPVSVQQAGDFERKDLSFLENGHGFTVTGLDSVQRQGWVMTQSRKTSHRNSFRAELLIKIYRVRVAGFPSGGQVAMVSLLNPGLVPLDEEGAPVFQQGGLAQVIRTRLNAGLGMGTTNSVVITIGNRAYAGDPIRPSVAFRMRETEIPSIGEIHRDRFHTTSDPRYKAVAATFYEKLLLEYRRRQALDEVVEGVPVAIKYYTSTGEGTRLMTFIPGTLPGMRSLVILDERDTGRQTTLETPIFSERVVEILPSGIMIVSHNDVDLHRSDFIERLLRDTEVRFRQTTNRRLAEQEEALQPTQDRATLLGLNDTEKRALAGAFKAAQETEQPKGTYKIYEIDRRRLSPEILPREVRGRLVLGALTHSFDPLTPKELKSLTENERTIVNLLLAGHTFEEVRRLRNTTDHNLRYWFDSAQRKLVSLRGNGDEDNWTNFYRDFVRLEHTGIPDMDESRFATVLQRMEGRSNPYLRRIVEAQQEGAQPVDVPNSFEEPARATVKNSITNARIVAREEAVRVVLPIAEVEQALVRAEILGTLQRADALDFLTPAEQRVVEAIENGATNQPEIGEVLGISRLTAKAHIDSIRRKQAGRKGEDTREEVIRKARRWWLTGSFLVNDDKTLERQIALLPPQWQAAIRAFLTTDNLSEATRKLRKEGDTSVQMTGYQTRLNQAVTALRLQTANSVPRARSYIPEAFRISNSSVGPEELDLPYPPEVWPLFVGQLPPETGAGLIATFGETGPTSRADVLRLLPTTDQPFPDFGLNGTPLDRLARDVGALLVSRGMEMTLVTAEVTQAAALLTTNNGTTARPLDVESGKRTLETGRRDLARDARIIPIR